jgi:acyl carrier protein
MKKKIKEALAKIFMTNVEDISDDISQGNFEKWDSMQHLMLIVELENIFDIYFEPEEITLMINIDAILDVVSKKV